MKHILLLSWKDIRHPKAWWAETVIHTYMTWLIQQWYRVTQIAPHFTGAKKEEALDGVEVKRIGSIHSIYFLCRIRYLFVNREKYDLIIDHAWGIPLLSPLYIRNKPIIFFIHHLWKKERNDYFYQRTWISALGSFFRRLYTSFVVKLYRKKPTITVSQWTANDLQQLWFTNLHILPNTTSYPLRTHCIAIKQRILTTVWRVVPNKQFDHAIRVVARLKNKWYTYTLYIAGPKQDLQEAKRLEMLISELNLVDNVFLTDKLSDEELITLRDKTYYWLITSDVEWFWLTTLEANKRAVPMFWYDIPWVNETIKAWVNGYLVEKNSWQEMAKLIATDSPDAYKTLVNTTTTFIQNYPTWTDNITSFTWIVENVS